MHTLSKLAAAGTALLTFSLLVLFVAPPAGAQTGAVVDALEDRGYYVAEDRDDVDRGAVADAVADARSDGVELHVAVLAEDPGGGDPGAAAQDYAQQVSQQLGGATVLVLSPDGIGGWSNRYSDQEVDAALDAAADDFSEFRDVEAVSSFAGALGSQPAGTGGGVSWFWWVLGLVVLGVGVASLISGGASRRRQAQMGRAELASARGELRRQGQAVADEVVALADQLPIAKSEAAGDHFARASTAYRKAIDAVDDTPVEHLSALPPVADDLDTARWHLQATRMAIKGKDVPKRNPNVRAGCFFDPAHGAGPWTAVVRAEGEKERKVRLCRSCADEVRAGAPPDPVLVKVRGREVPVAMAPRTHGGGDLPDLRKFALLLGEDEPVPFDWSRFRGLTPASISAGRSSSTGTSTPRPAGGGYVRYPPRRRRYYGGGWGGGWGGPVGRPRSGGGMSRGGGGRSRGGGGGMSRGGGGGMSRGGGGGRRR